MAQESVSAERRKILVVDDQPMLTKAIRRMLSDHEVITVTCAREAIARIESGERYDIILSDLMMPGVSGMELRDTLERVAPDQVCRMVFMTGGAFTAKAREFFERVNNPTIEKPFDKAQLFKVIDTLLPH